MLTVSLVCAPGSRRLTAGIVEDLRASWGGGPTVWLAPQEAAEFRLPGEPSDFAAHRKILRGCGPQGGGIDLAIQPTAGRRKRLLVADMDSTMIEEECIDELAAEADARTPVAAITARAMRGEIEFEAALRARVLLLAGLEGAAIARVLARITLAPGAATLIATMRANGAHTALLTGGFMQFAQPVGRRLAFDEVHASDLLEAGGRLTGEVAGPILGRREKGRLMGEIAGRLGLDPSATMAVGDGANDLDMIALAGTGVALRAKPEVEARARIGIRHGDLTALLYLQGYRQDEFVHVR